MLTTDEWSMFVDVCCPRASENSRLNKPSSSVVRPSLYVPAHQPIIEFLASSDPPTRALPVQTCVALPPAIYGANHVGR